MELQKSSGQLTSVVKSLKESIEKQDNKLTKIEDCVTGVIQKIYAAGVVLTILVVIGSCIVNKSWDMMISQVSSRNHTHTIQPTKQ